VKDFDAKMF